jgi:hypothetical protein
VLQQILVDELRGNRAFELSLDGGIVLVGVDKLVRKRREPFDQLRGRDWFVCTRHKRKTELEQRLRCRDHPAKTPLVGRSTTLFVLQRLCLFVLQQLRETMMVILNAPADIKYYTADLISKLDPPMTTPL